MQIIFTLGHSSHTWDRFSQLLAQFDVGCVVDVRSRPRSRWANYSHPNFRIRLNEVGVSYLFMGDCLGGQPKSGPVDYCSIAASDEFKSAIDQVVTISKRCRVALVCSEHDPIRCHRFLLISRVLAARDIEVQHILRDGTVESHTAALRRLERTFPAMPLLAHTSESDWLFDAQEKKLKQRSVSSRQGIKD